MEQADIDEELGVLLAKFYEKMEVFESKLIPLRKALSTDRNEPCPCNSGKKSKKCCNTPPNTRLFLKLREKHYLGLRFN